jgi:23S rRNA (cytosine1962-C5)-methyltransferase
MSVAVSTSASARIDRRTTPASLPCRWPSIRRSAPTGFGDDAAIDRNVDDYQLIDAGDATRLERFGAVVVTRPAPGAGAPRRLTTPWEDTDLRFERDTGWTGSASATARDGWTVRFGGLTLELRTTAAGQVGLFPEHGAMLSWLRDRVRKRSGQPTVLNLFAHTGLTTLAMTEAGAATAHVDASRPTVDWARRNAAINSLADRPIRWLVDDAAAFVAREIRRGRRYDGIVLDPPTYGHGPGGRTWRLDADLPPLLEAIGNLLTPGAFILLTAHAEGLRPDDLGGMLAGIADDVEAGRLDLIATSGAVLSLGAYARSLGA